GGEGRRLADLGLREEVPDEGPCGRLGERRLLALLDPRRLVRQTDDDEVPQSPLCVQLPAIFPRVPPDPTKGSRAERATPVRTNVRNVPPGTVTRPRAKCRGRASGRPRRRSPPAARPRRSPSGARRRPGGSPCPDSGP